MDAHAPARFALRPRKCRRTALFGRSKLDYRAGPRCGWRRITHGCALAARNSANPSRTSPRYFALSVELEQARLAPGRFAAKIFVRAWSGHAPARRAVDHADLHEIGLVHFFDGVFLFGERRGKRAEANRAAAVLVEQRQHQVAVHFVEAIFIHAEHLQRFLGHGARDAACGAHFREVARTAQQPVGDTRRAPAAARDFFSAAFVDLYAQDS